jgi:beta-glucanase (GH16 family)
MEPWKYRGALRVPVSKLTHQRRAGVVLLTLLLGPIVGIACKGSSSSSEDWTEGPPSEASVTGTPDGADGGPGSPAKDAGMVSLPPESTLCKLSGPPKAQPGDVLVFSDEFEGSAVDQNKWNIANGYKGHGGDLNTSAPANDVVQNGMLSMVTEKSGDPMYPYVSGYIDTLGKYARTYGKVEFRARFPYAGGVWFAIWGRPWWQSFPEIDIEVVNNVADPHTQLYFVNHWAAPPLPADERRRYVMMENVGVDYSQFHVYTIYSTPDLLEWRIDGVPKMQSTPATKGVPTDPVYWIINGWVGGWPGNPNQATPFPNTFDVDYMRVYRVNGLIADPVVKVVLPKATYSQNELIHVVTANFDEACSHVQMFDDATLVRETALPPYVFATTPLAKGAHHLSFVATDGVRSTTTTLDVKID